MERQAIRIHLRRWKFGEGADLCQPSVLDGSSLSSWNEEQIEMTGNLDPLIFLPTRNPTRQNHLLGQINNIVIIWKDYSVKYSRVSSVKFQHKYLDIQPKPLHSKPSLCQEPVLTTQFMASHFLSL